MHQMAREEAITLKFIILWHLIDMGYDTLIKGCPPFAYLHTTVLHRYIAPLITKRIYLWYE